MDERSYTRLMTPSWSEHAGPRGAEYDERWARLEASGADIHGEADLVVRYAPGSVLDAGCGTGRVAIELHRRGVDVVGTDLDEAMLASAREKAPDLTWVAADLSALDLTDAAGERRRFDLAVLAGNVMIFVARGTEGAVLANLATRLAPGGLVVAGFQLSGRLPLAEYDALASGAGLGLRWRWSTWDRAPFRDASDYAVSVHERVSNR